MFIKLISGKFAIVLTLSSDQTEAKLLRHRLHLISISIRSLFGYIIVIDTIAPLQKSFTATSWWKRTQCLLERMACSFWRLAQIFPIFSLANEFEDLMYTQSKNLELCHIVITDGAFFVRNFLLIHKSLCRPSVPGKFYSGDDCMKRLKMFSHQAVRIRPKAFCCSSILPQIKLFLRLYGICAKCYVTIRPVAIPCSSLSCSWCLACNGNTSANRSSFFNSNCYAINRPANLSVVSTKTRGAHNVRLRQSEFLKKIHEQKIKNIGRIIMNHTCTFLYVDNLLLLTEKRQIVLW